jgi:hypothetical protein
VKSNITYKTKIQEEALYFYAISNGKIGDTITLDKTAPTGSIDLVGLKEENGRKWVTSEIVTLLIRGTDTLSGVSKMKVWNENQSEPVEWSGYTESLMWLLSAGEGQKRINVRFVDKAGNISVGEIGIGFELIKRGKIIGKVTKEGETEHSGVSVVVNGTSYSGSSDRDGNYIIENVPEGVYSLSMTANGYIRYESYIINVVAGEVTTIGDVMLTKVRGKVQGVVRLEGRSEHSGIEVYLLGSTYKTTTDIDGKYEFVVPVGNYNGIKSEKRNYGDGTYNETITVTEYGVANVPLITMKAVSNDVNGRARLYNKNDHRGIKVELMGKVGEVTEGKYYSKVIDDINGYFRIDGVAIGPYSVKYSYQPGWEVINRDVVVTGGESITLAYEILREMYVKINGDDEWTTSANVVLSLNTSDCYQMMISNHGDFSGASWEACASTKNWVLEGGDGIKTVYAKFMDSQMNETPVVSDDIILDRTAVITEVWHNGGGGPKHRNDVIHFRLNANGETGGVAKVDIVGYLNNILLYDDGTNGDGVANDGIYELDYKIVMDKDVNNGSVIGRFTDRCGNVATPVTATSTITIVVPPFIRNIVVIPNSATGYAEVRWETDELTTGKLEWGESQFYGNTAYSNTPKTIHSIIIGGGSLQPSTPYHYRITAKDMANNESMTSDQIFYMRPNPPNRVITMGGDGRMDIRWEAPPQENVVGYNIYRSLVEGGPYVKINSGGLYNDDALVYTDPAAQNGVKFCYVITAVDEYNNESEYSAESCDIPMANSGPTMVGGAITNNTVWSTKGSPYIVENNLSIEEGKYLAIAPGTEVRFKQGKKMIVLGNIYVLGRSDARVNITSDSVSPRAGDWSGIEIMNYSPKGRFYLDEMTYYSGNIVSFADLSYGVDVVKVTNSTIFLSSSSIANSYSSLSVKSCDNIVVKNSVFNNCYSNSKFNCIYLEDSNLILKETELSGATSQEYHIYIYTKNHSNNINTIIFDKLNLSSNVGVSLGLEIYINKPYKILIYESNINSINVSNSFLNPNYERSKIILYNSVLGGFYASSAYLDLYFLGSLIGNNNRSFDLKYYGDTSNKKYHTFLIYSSKLLAQRFTLRSREVMTGGIFNSIVDSSSSIYISKIYDFPYQIFAINFNNFSSPQTGKYNIENWQPYNSEPINAQYNYWGPETTQEMDNKGPNSNITAIYDYYDNVLNGKVDYSNWSHSAYPQAKITSPRFGKMFKLGKSIEFRGEGDDYEDGPIPSQNLSWWDEKDNRDLGVGSVVTVNNLSTGVHKIWLTVKDSTGQEGKVFTEVEILE